MTLSKIIEQLKAADQNKTGMFELGEDVMCALVDLLERRERDKQEPVSVVQPVMFIDGDISSDDADKLAKIIRGFNEEDERPLAKMARIIRENPHPTNECDMPKAPPAQPVAAPVRYMNRYTGACYTLEQQPDAATDTMVYVPLYDVAQPVAVPELNVWYGPMPESNGKTNWTASLHRKGDPVKGFTIDRSEYPDRVRYEADRMRWLIGELPDEPDILAYDENKHSGYVSPKSQPVAVPDAVDYSDLDAASQDREVIEAIAECKGWNACRAAMLNQPSSIEASNGEGARAEIKQPASNSPERSGDA